MKLLKFFSPLILFCALTVFGNAVTSNQTISFQGFLAESNGNPYKGQVNMGFKFYDGSNGIIIDLVQNNRVNPVTIFNGNYTTKIDLSLTEIWKIAGASDLWIEVWVNGNRMDPKIEMTPAPYAMLVKGLKYDAADDVVMVGYVGSAVTANARGGLVVADTFVIGSSDGAKSNTLSDKLQVNGSVLIEGIVSTNSVEGSQVFGAVWN